MERFEIALSLNDKELLIPSMLPKEKPGMQLHQLHKMIRKTSQEKVWPQSCKSSIEIYFEIFKTNRFDWWLLYVP